MGIIISLIIGLILWFLYYSLELGLNGVSDTYLNCLRQEWLWATSSKARADFIRDHIEGCELGTMCSFSGKSWRYSEIRDNNLYSEVGKAMLPGLPHFLFTHIFLPASPLLIFLIFKIL